MKENKVLAPKWKRWEGIIPVEAEVIGFDGYQNRVLVEFSKGDRKWISMKVFNKMNENTTIKIKVEYG